MLSAVAPLLPHSLSLSLSLTHSLCLWPFNLASRAFTLRRKVCNYYIERNQASASQLSRIPFEWMPQLPLKLELPRFFALFLAVVHSLFASELPVPLGVLVWVWVSLIAQHLNFKCRLRRCPSGRLYYFHCIPHASTDAHTPSGQANKMSGLPVAR